MNQDSLILEWPEGLATHMVERGSYTSHQRPSLSRATLTQRERLELKRAPNLSLAPVLPIRASSFQEGTSTPQTYKKGPYGGRGVTVALLDSGVDPTHEAFEHLTTLETHDFTGQGLQDRNGHGTYCASVIFGSRGLAPHTERALSARILNNSGRGDTQAMYEGLLWACDKEADIISISVNLGFRPLLCAARETFEAEEMAHAWALDAWAANALLLGALTTYANARCGALVIASTGNDSSRRHGRIHPPAPPASLPGVLSVGGLSCTHQGKWRGLSSSNIPADVGAPGENIQGAVAGTLHDWTTKTGSSMAAAYVAGVAAQWREAKGSCAWEEMLQHAQRDVFVDTEEGQHFGFGMIRSAF